MVSIDIKYRNARNGIRPHIGALLATLVLFVAIASTGRSVGKLKSEAQADKPVYYLAPPKELSEARSVTPKTTRTVETFPVEIPSEREAIEIELDQLDVSLKATVSSDLSLSFDIERTFQASAPDLGGLDDFQIFEKSEVDEKPVIRFAREPEVPYRLRGKKVSVTVFYYVTAKGETDTLSILDSSSPNPEYAEAAREAIADWRFRPARKDGRPVACWVQQTIIFNRGSTSPFSI